MILPGSAQYAGQFFKRNQMKINTKKRKEFLLSLLLCSLGCIAIQAKAQITPDDPRYYIQDYTSNQTFRGQSFFKDNNIWVYSKKFAETFTMPQEGISNELKGIEAAAFRIEEMSYKLCGMGGKAEQCRAKNERCMLDVYIDERVYPLPWRSEQHADWYEKYTSLNWLIGANQADFQITKQFTPNIVFRGIASLHPFADPQTTKEAVYFYMSINDKYKYGNALPMLAYKRSAVANLTLISFSGNCMTAESPTAMLYRLESRDELFSDTLKRFHEFILPEVFVRRMNNLLKENSDANFRYYRSLLPKQSSQNNQINGEMK